LKVLGFLAACVLLAACGGGPGTRLATAEDTVSYLIGYQMGRNLKQQGAPTPTPAILRGLSEAFAGTDAAIPDSTARAFMMAYQQRSMIEARRNDSIASSRNEAEALAFFPANGKKPGVTTTSSGLQWRMIKAGTGPRPKPTSRVQVHYVGTLLSGEEFDRSPSGQPIEFGLNEVIPGWTEAVSLMNAGAKYEFWIPAALAYGDRGAPPKIGPDAALRFEVELVSFR